MINNQTQFDEEILEFIKVKFKDNNLDFNHFIKNNIFIDFGNSNAKLLFNNELHSISYEKIEIELFELFSDYLKKFEYKKTNTIEIYYSNVKKLDIEKIGEYFINQIKINFFVDFIFLFKDVREIIDSETIKKSFNYLNIKGIGTDRLLGLYLANSYFVAQTNITIDFGTAITINIIDAKGEILGGQIIPGLFLQLNSLNLNTAGINLENQNIIEYFYNKISDLGLNDLNLAKLNQIGINTIEAVLNGIFSNIIGSIINFMNSEEVLNNSPSHIIFTGSYSKVFFDIFKAIKNKNNDKHLNIKNIKLHHSNLLNIYSILLLSINSNKN